MIDIAYGQFANPPLLNDATVPNSRDRIRGGPAWAQSDLYTIDAVTADPVADAAPGPVGPRGFNPGYDLMRGAMFRSLLEDRFHLQTHRRNETVPMYALTAASGGLRLTPFEEGNCVEIASGIFPYPGGFKWGRDPKPPCNWIGWDVNGPNRTVEGGSVQLSRLAEALGDLFMDRHVLDQTGVPTKFNLHLEYLPDEHTPANLPGPMRSSDPASTAPRAPTIFRAIEEQLGLKLESAQGPREYIAIDGMDRPDLN
jgi:uncharacterized protein (TIGR03435 family)